MTVSVGGLLLTLVSAFCNGTFNTFGKLCKEPPDPVIFNACLCVGCGLSSFAVIAFFPLLNHAQGPWPVGFSPQGFLAGGMLVLATLFTFAAIPLIGLAKGTPTWCTFAILTAFSWGAMGPREPGPGAPVKNMPLSILAMLLIVIGVLIINFASKISGALELPTSAEMPSANDQDMAVVISLPDDTAAQEARGRSWSKLGEEEVEGLEGTVIGAATAQTARPRAPSVAKEVVVVPPALADNSTAEPEKQPPDNSGNNFAKTVLGLLFAFGSGAFGGSILVPASYVSQELKGLPLLPSFGAGAVIVGILVTLTYWLFVKRQPLGNLRKELRLDVVWKGGAAGCIWNTGNICQIIAMDVMGMPYGIAAPIFQCALVVSGIWAIYFFHEVVNRKTIRVFWIGTLILLGGVVCLGMNGPGAA